MQISNASSNQDLTQTMESAKVGRIEKVKNGHVVLSAPWRSLSRQTLLQ